MDKRAEGGLKMGKTDPVRENPLGHKKQSHNIPLNLKLLYATEPCPLTLGRTIKINLYCLEIPCIH